MDLNESAVFVKVVDAGSFSAAARFLGLPTSTVSTRITRLEKRLGVMLLQRTTRQLRLTEAGKLYYQHASIGLAHMLDAEAAVSASGDEPKGLLRITAPADIGDALLAEIVTELRREYPQISIDMMLVNRYVDLVAEGVDVAIRTGELKDSTLIAKKVGMARWAMFASPAYLKSSPPLKTPQMLAQHCCLQFPALGKDNWTFKNKNDHLTIPLTGQVLVNDVRIIHSMSLAGEGVALLPEYMCQADCDEGRLMRILPEWRAKEDPVHIVYPRQRFIAPKLRAFIDLASKKLSDKLA